jgi:hypothetical protein
MNELRHDAATLRDHAGRVERSAMGAMVGMTLLGFLIGAGFALIFAGAGSSGLVLAVLSVGLGLVGGFLTGDALAEHLRLAARMAMAQAAMAEKLPADQSVVSGPDQG